MTRIGITCVRCHGQDTSIYAGQLVAADDRNAFELTWFFQAEMHGERAGTTLVQTGPATRTVPVGDRSRFSGYYRREHVRLGTDLDTFRTAMAGTGLCGPDLQAACSTHLGIEGADRADMATPAAPGDKHIEQEETAQHHGARQ